MGIPVFCKHLSSSTCTRIPSDAELVKGEDGGGANSEGEKPWGASCVPGGART